MSVAAEADAQWVGHVAISPVQITDGSPGWYGLGPVSVLPGVPAGCIQARPGRSHWRQAEVGYASAFDTVG